MLDISLDEQEVTFKKKTNISYNSFKEHTYDSVTNFFFRLVKFTKLQPSVIREFVEKSYENLLKEIHHFDTRQNFVLFAANSFALSINEELFNYQMNTDFVNHIYNPAYTAADLIPLFHLKS